jgi:predicted metal-dependent peptidase
MSAQELTNHIARNSQKRLLRSSRKHLPQRCRFHAACGQAATRWAWHSYLLKLIGVCDRCFELNEYLREPKAKK